MLTCKLVNLCLATLENKILGKIHFHVRNFAHLEEGEKSKVLDGTKKFGGRAKKHFGLLHYALLKSLI